MDTQDRTSKAPARRPVAVALKYEVGQEGAPVVAAQGRGAVAEKILEAAREANVPVVEQSEMAESLAKIEVDREIPPSLYRAVAEVLAYVYRLDKQMLQESHL